MLLKCTCFLNQRLSLHRYSSRLLGHVLQLSRPPLFMRPVWNRRDKTPAFDGSSPFSFSFRSLHTTTNTSSDNLKEKSSIQVIFVTPEGEEIECRATEGESLLDIAHHHHVDLEGACESSLACSTCHVILEPHVFDALPEASDEENDMLDLAFGLTATSRLGCQVKVSLEMDGVKVRIPSATRNMAVDGFKPKPH